MKYLRFLTLGLLMVAAEAADGSGQASITNSNAQDHFLAWQPLPAASCSTPTADGMCWQRHPSNPILQRGAAPGGWADVNIGRFTVLPTDGGYQIWTGGVAEDLRNRIGTGTSADGISWAMDGLVLDIGGGQYDGVSYPNVIRDGTLCRMYLYGRGPSPFPAGRGAIGYSQAAYDGTDCGAWSAPTLILDVGANLEQFGPKVLKIAVGDYRMWFGAGDPSSPGAFRVGYATSTDGMAWIFHGWVLTAGAPGDWDDCAVTVDEVIAEGNVYKMWYSGRSACPSGDLRIGYAVSPDGINWKKLGVVLEATEPGTTYGASGSSSTVILTPGSAQFWYNHAGSWDWGISYAMSYSRAPDDESDGVHNGIDNCPDDFNPLQENGDGDQWGDACDACPTTATVWLVPIGDGDCDGFTDGQELFVGTDPNDACPDDLDDDTWPADLATIEGYGKHDGTSDIFDIVELTPPVFGNCDGAPEYTVRKDLDRFGAPPDCIDIFDIVRLTPPVFGQSCTP